ncbi:monocyte to macrophage differentiation factor [Diachasma alloeum]|uniref:monocyte to macrophage differentiation factor n=1 Tax=Diachasma alloeum TaxID=454923 RepID=UPI0007384D18|nr:monocyte to macrophage differentiation factor [Diachasma alloeum]XP_015112664.1 monocyte to macrophage differentiation factor [Diachasma alloeum]
MDGPCLAESIMAPMQKLRGLKDIKWMNSRATTNKAYTPTCIEHCANIMTHGIWIVPALFASIELLRRSMTSTQLISALVYGIALLLLFLVSTSFHTMHYCDHKQWKDVLHRCDRAMIYVFIAATYFPWLMVEDFPDNEIVPTMRYLVWIMATIGILYQQMFHERYKMLETIFYLIMGVGPSIAVITVNKFDNIRELKTGGFIYIAGLIFFKSDGRIPCAHAIWHIFVTVGAGFHYYAILNHLYPFVQSGHPTLPLIDWLESHREL